MFCICILPYLTKANFKLANPQVWERSLVSYFITLRFIMISYMKIWDGNELKNNDLNITDSFTMIAY